MKEMKIVLDHDGTLTDGQKEMQEYCGIVDEWMARQMEMNGLEMHNLMHEARTSIMVDREAAWIFGEYKVAPAMADHFILNQMAAGRVAAERWKLSDSGEFRRKLFAETSGLLGEFYKPGVALVLKELLQMAGDRFQIVTNSKTEGVQAKLIRLMGDGAEKISILGGAGKYLVDRNWTGVVPVGPYQGFDGFPLRGVELQRRIYYDLLLKIGEGDLTRLVIGGDIAELDLLMADYLGVMTGLVVGEMTVPWERKHFTNSGAENRFAGNLEEVVAWMLDLH